MEEGNGAEATEEKEEIKLIYVFWARASSLLK